MNTSPHDHSPPGRPGDPFYPCRFAIGCKKVPYLRKKRKKIENVTWLSGGAGTRPVAAASATVRSGANSPCPELCSPRSTRRGRVREARLTGLLHQLRGQDLANERHLPALRLQPPEQAGKRELGLGERGDDYILTNSAWKYGKKHLIRAHY